MSQNLKAPSVAFSVALACSSSDRKSTRHTASVVRGDSCHQSGENRQQVSLPKGKEDWVLRSHGCPDHPYFGEPVKMGGAAWWQWTLHSCQFQQIRSMSR